MKFKVGDRVKVTGKLRSKHGLMLKDCVGTIIDLGDAAYAILDIEGKLLGNESGIWFDELELVARLPKNYKPDQP